MFVATIFTKSIENPTHASQLHPSPGHHHALQVQNRTAPASLCPQRIPTYPGRGNFRNESNCHSITGTVSTGGRGYISLNTVAFPRAPTFFESVRLPAKRHLEAACQANTVGNTQRNKSKRASPSRKRFFRGFVSRRRSVGTENTRRHDGPRRLSRRRRRRRRRKRRRRRWYVRGVVRGACVVERRLPHQRHSPPDYTALSYPLAEPVIILIRSWRLFLRTVSSSFRWNPVRCTNQEGTSLDNVDSFE